MTLKIGVEGKNRRLIEQNEFIEQIAAENKSGEAALTGSWKTLLLWRLVSWDGITWNLSYNWNQSTEPVGANNNTGTIQVGSCCGGQNVTGG